MRGTIVTHHGNQLHQLLVSVSKHFYFGADGQLRYQQKPMEVTLKNAGSSRKEHLVYYVMRDHYSGAFVLRMATTRSLLSLADFLYLAWSEEAPEDNYLYGMPEELMVPKAIAAEDLLAGLQSLGIPVVHPASGFASGVRIFRDIEEHLYFALRGIADHGPAAIDGLRKQLYRHIIVSGGLHDKWSASLADGQVRLRRTPEKEAFLACFPAEEDGRAPQAADEGSSQRSSAKAKKDKPATAGSGDPLPRFNELKLEEAQGMIFEAWSAPTRTKQLALAKKALKLSPYCADGYNLLAACSRSPEERLGLYEQGVRAGRAALGEDIFLNDAGYFWGLVETRPYMRSLAGLMEELWKLGRRAEAIANGQELLRLNPGDNQGNRYTLLHYLLMEGMDAAAGELISEYDEDTCFWLYSDTLLALRMGDELRAHSSLRRAMEANPHVPDYVLGRRRAYTIPSSYSWGSTEEAVVYAAMGGLEAWRAAPDALEWLARKTP